MSLAIDIIFLIIIAIPIISGVRKGFVKTIMGLLSVFLAVLAAYLLSPRLVPLCRNKIVDPYISEPLRGQIQSMIGDSDTNLDVLDSLSEVPQGLSDICATFGLDLEDVRKGISDKVSEGVEAGKTSASDYVSSLVIEKTAEIISYIGVFLIALLLLQILTLILGAIFKMPILSGLNKLIGAVFGFACGGAAVFVIAKILLLLMPTLVSLYPGTFTGVADKSVILSLIGGLK